MQRYTVMSQIGVEIPVLQYAQCQAMVSTVSTWMGGICTDRVGHSLLDSTNMQISESGLLTLGQCEGMVWTLINPPGLTLHSHSTQV